MDEDDNNENILTEQNKEEEGELEENQELDDNGENLNEFENNENNDFENNNDNNEIDENNNEMQNENENNNEIYNENENNKEIQNENINEMQNKNENNNEMQDENNNEIQNENENNNEIQDENNNEIYDENENNNELQDKNENNNEMYDENENNNEMHDKNIENENNERKKYDDLDLDAFHVDELQIIKNSKNNESNEDIIIDMNNTKQTNNIKKANENKNEEKKLNESSLDNSNEIISKLKNELKAKEQELVKVADMNTTIRKNFEQLSNELNKYVQKALDEKNSKRKIGDEDYLIEEHKKEIEVKDKQINNSLSMIKYLQRDNQRLKNELEKLNNLTKVSLNDQLQSKQKEIENLNNQNKEIRKELNSYKSSDKVILALKNKNAVLRDTVDRLNQRIEELRKEINRIKAKELDIKNISSLNTSGIRSSLNTNVCKKYLKMFGEQRSVSMFNLHKNNIKKMSNFYQSGKNFYKLFSDTERKAISMLFNSDKDYNIFKQKIDIIENRNRRFENILKNENKELSKINIHKDKTILQINEKVKDNERKIKFFENKIINQKKINAYLVKESKRQIVLEKNYIDVINIKDEEIQKLKGEIMVLNQTIEQLKSEIKKLNIEKKKENELKEIKNELGEIKVIDANKVIKITKIFSVDILKQNREIEHNYKGKEKIIPHNRANTEKTNNKKKSKKKSMNNKKGKENGGVIKNTKTSNKTTKKIILENDNNGKEKVNNYINV